MPRESGDPLELSLNARTVVVLTLLVTGCGGGSPSPPPDPPDVSASLVAAYESEDSVRSLSPVRIQGSARSLSRTPLKIQWSQISGPPVGISRADTLELAFYAPIVDEDSVVTLRLSAEDSHNQSAFADVSFVVVPIATPGVGGSYPYPLDSSPQSLLSNTSVDSAGVILDPYARGNGYHPGVVARFATALYRRYVYSGGTNADALTQAVQNANWLADNLECNSGIGVWSHMWPHAPYTDEPDWASGMSNAIALAAMVQLAPYSGQSPDYGKAIQCALNAFEEDVSRGGVYTRTGGGARWYEEVAAPTRAAHLNGMLFALAGLHVVWKLGGYAQAGDAFGSGVDAVRERLPLYDDGFTSLYNLLPTDPDDQPRRTHAAYNGIHVKQLLWLYGVTGDPMFLDYAHRFLTYDNRIIGSARVEVVLADGTRQIVADTNALFDGLKYQNEINVEGAQLEVTLGLNRLVQTTQLVLFAPGTRMSLSDITVASDRIAGHLDTLVPATYEATHRTPATDTGVFIYPLPTDAGVTDQLQFRMERPTNETKFRLRELMVHWEDGYEFALEIYRDLALAYGWPPPPADGG